MITIINFGLGNLSSIHNMLKRIGIDAIVTSDINVIEKADKLILPGVGAFDHGMKNISEIGLLPILNKLVLNQGMPILGICLGMQLMTQKSEEGELPGLGWFDAATIRFNPEKSYSVMKIPHMGWNTVKVHTHQKLFNEIHEEPRFYFVHSYHVVCLHDNDIMTTTFYGYDFVSAMAKENIVGVQFHPEKSHKFGMTFLRNWVLS